MNTSAVVAYDEQQAHPIDLDRWAGLAQAVLGDEGAGAGELTLVFVDEAVIAALHEEHMGDPEPTDVLSFPIDADDAAAGEDATGIPRLLGDVVVCPAVAARNAPAHAGSFEDELALLVVHGVLHVLGHDHRDPEETRAMQARERALLERHHWHGDAPASFRPSA